MNAWKMSNKELAKYKAVAKIAIERLDGTIFPAGFVFPRVEKHAIGRSGRAQFCLYSDKGLVYGSLPSDFELVKK